MLWHFFAQTLRHITPISVAPDDFIPYAQECDLITRIDDWVIDEACKQAARWRELGFTINLAVNISARQFHNHLLIKTVQQTLEKYCLSAENFVVEITEQMFLENTLKKYWIRTLHLLHAPQIFQTMRFR